MKGLMLQLDAVNENLRNCYYEIGKNFDYLLTELHDRQKSRREDILRDMLSEYRYLCFGDDADSPFEDSAACGNSSFFNKSIHALQLIKPYSKQAWKQEYSNKMKRHVERLKCLIGQGEGLMSEIMNSNLADDDYQVPSLNSANGLNRSGHRVFHNLSMADVVRNNASGTHNEIYSCRLSTLRDKSPLVEGDSAPRTGFDLSDDDQLQRSLMMNEDRRRHDSDGVLGRLRTLPMDDDGDDLKFTRTVQTHFQKDLKHAKHSIRRLK